MKAPLKKLFFSFSTNRMAIPLGGQGPKLNLVFSLPIKKNEEEKTKNQCIKHQAIKHSFPPPQHQALSRFVSALQSSSVVVAERRKFNLFSPHNNKNLI